MSIKERGKEVIRIVKPRPRMRLVTSKFLSRGVCGHTIYEGTRIWLDEDGKAWCTECTNKEYALRKIEEHKPVTDQMELGI